MRVTSHLLVCSLFAAAMACAVAPRVEIDRLEGADLAAYESFALSDSTDAGVDPSFGPSAREAARSAARGELRARGLRAVDDPGDADLLVSVVVTSRTRIEGGDVFVTPGHPHVVRRRTGLRTPVGDVPLREDHHVVHHGPTLDHGPAYEVSERMVVLDLYEADTARLVWRGTTRGPRGRKLDAQDLRERVKAIAAQFP